MRPLTTAEKIELADLATAECPAGGAEWLGALMSIAESKGYFMTPDCTCKHDAERGHDAACGYYTTG